MAWYEYWAWKTYGKSRSILQCYNHYVWLLGDDYPNEESIRSDCKLWAEGMPGRHIKLLGFEKVSSPPQSVLEKMIADKKHHIKRLHKELNGLQKTLRKLR